MPIDLKMESNGAFLNVYAFGKLEKKDYDGLGEAFSRHAEEQEHLRVLLDMTGLEGWRANAIWEEIKFDTKYMSKISRLAVVGSKEWQHALASVSKPFTHAETRYFDAAQAVQAREWLATA